MGLLLLLENDAPVLDALSFYPDFPDLRAEIAFASDPADPPVWSNVSLFLKRFSSRRGRGKELDRTQAGTLLARFESHDRRFDPLYTSSPYFPNIVPFRRVRISALWPPRLWGGFGVQVVYPIFTGYVESWNFDYVGANLSYVEIDAVDAFEPLAAADLVNTGAWPQERTGARANRMLDAIGWSSADRLIETGLSDIQASGDYVDAANVLGELHGVAETELGFLFVDGAGRVVLHDRHHRIKNNSIVQAVFGDDAPAGGELPYLSLKPLYEGASIRNDVTVDRPGGTLQRAEDQPSIDRFLRRGLPVRPRLASDTEAADMAGYLLARYKSPEYRFSELTLNPRMDLALWPHVLGRELGDRLRVIERPLDIGAAIDKEVHIESVAHDVARTSWRTTYQVSPADVQSYWVLDSAANSVLDSTTRLAY